MLKIVWTEEWHTWQAVPGYQFVGWGWRSTRGWKNKRGLMWVKASSCLSITPVFTQHFLAPWNFELSHQLRACNRLLTWIKADCLHERKTFSAGISLVVTDMSTTCAGVTTWLLRWLSLNLSKHQSPPTTVTVFLRSPHTQTIHFQENHGKNLRWMNLFIRMKYISQKYHSSPRTLFLAS